MHADTTRRAIHVRGPRDVPGLRDHLLEHWLAGGSFAETSAFTPSAWLTQLADAEREPGYHQRTLADAQLWWVSAEMCALLAAAEASVPDDTRLDATLVPSPRGLVVFEHTLSGHDAQADRTVHVDAMTWGPVRLAKMEALSDGSVRVAEPRELLDAIGMTSYRRHNADDGLSAEELAQVLRTGAIAQAQMDEPDIDANGNVSVRLHGDVWGWLGRGDWLAGTAVAHRETCYSELSFASIVEDRRRLAALWLLIAQPGMTTVRESHGDRAEHRRAQRAGRAAPTVCIVDVARAHRRPTTGDDSDGHRHVGVRFPVSGHWRRQAYGPERAYRRPTWIAPHWRGPDDAPLSNVEHVRVLRGPR